jgi:DNA topoisomerase-1
MRDARVARVVRELLAVRAKEVFVFEAPRAAGRPQRAARRLVDVRRRHVNEYLAEATGERITAKDFRTWAGTLVCAATLAQAGLGTSASATQRRRIVTGALRQTADLLGNTPAVCRKSYVFAAILTAHDRGRVVPSTAPTVVSLLTHDPRLQRLERAVLALLRGARPRRRRTRTLHRISSAHSLHVASSPARPLSGASRTRAV